MNIRNLAIAFSIFVGIGMLATWTILLATGNVPDLQTSPREASFLLLAEFITAILNLIAAYGLLRHRNWGIAIDLIALGMLLYCAIYSIGVFSQQANIPATIFFVIMALLAGMISGRLITQSAISITRA
jgi:hypothetical protein